MRMPNYKYCTQRKAHLFLMSWLETLQNKKGDKVVAAEALAGKVVALYFSAHW